MKRLLVLFLTLACMLCFTACSKSDTDNSKPQTETNNTMYKVELAEDYPLENSLKNSYAAGEQVTIKLATVTEHYYVVYVNGTEQDKDRNASDDVYTYYTFTMPSEDVLIAIEDHWVTIPEAP